MSTNESKSSSIPVTVKERVSMAMTKGRPGSLSMPSFSFRFKNTDDECLEELNLSEISESTEASCDKLTEENSELDVTVTPSPPVTPSKSVTKLIKPKIFDKRTQSLDDGSPEHSSTFDTWSLLSEIKGKIARTVGTVEEKLHSSGIYKKDTVRVMKPISPVEAEEATEELEAGEAVKSDSSPFSLRKMLTAYESSPQLRLRRKEVHVQPPPSIEEAVTFSDLLSVNSEDINLTEHSSLEKSSPKVVPDACKEEETSPAPTSAFISPQEDSTLPTSATQTLDPVSTWRQKWLRYKNQIYFALFGFFIWFIMPPFVSGLILGFSLALTVYANRFFRPLNPPRNLLEDGKQPLEAIHTLRSDSQLPTVRKVWMNELLSVYSPENYHLNMTQSVLVRLDGPSLRLSYPKSKVHKRAMWNESIHESSFVHQKYYDLKGAKLDLLPDGLARKRRWSRRYPIQICFNEAPMHRDSTSLHPQLTKENDRVIILFARSGRDKEEWFWRFKEAILYATEKNDLNSAAENKNIQNKLFKYHVYMSRLIQTPNVLIVSSDSGSSASKQNDSSSVDSNSSSPVPPSFPDHVEWLNILLGRCCSDVLLDSEENEWIEKISDRIQRKLSLIKVPYFMEELRLSDLEIGSQLPQIGSVSAPYLNDRGLWFDVNISYFGSFRMTLETKLNLLRLKRDSRFEGVEIGKEPGSSNSESNGGGGSSGSLPRLSAIYDSEAEESVESSSDEEPFPDTQSELNDEPGRAVTGNKIFRFVDSIAQSRYFQHAAENKYVKKAMVGVSNTPLILTVELLNLSGTLAVNIPPPPTDRLWYGFRTNPDLVLVAKPKVGERQVQIAQVTEWIEKKLIVEFQRILVLPNMEDLVIPILNPHSSPIVSSSAENEVKEKTAD